MKKKTAMAPPQGGRKLARVITKSFGTPPSFSRHHNEGESAFVDIVSCADSPAPGLTSFATIGVCAAPLVIDGREIPIRAELVGACQTRYTEFESCLATAAFCVLASKWVVTPDTVFPDVVGMYYSSVTTQHLWFTSWVPWDDLPPFVEIDGKKVSWLMAVPITESEYRFAVSKGVPALEEAIERGQADVFDLNRPSVI